MNREKASYSDDKQFYEGYLAYNSLSSNKRKRPIVLLCPSMYGMNSFIKDKAEMIADLGCIAFVVDLYGEGKQTSSEEDAKAWMKPLFENRKVLRHRLSSAYHYIKSHGVGDEEQIAAIGFCFGGTCVLEMAKSGLPLKGVVSFHGVLGNPFKQEVKWEPTVPKINSQVLVLHGSEDPLVSKEDLNLFQEEMKKAQADWQLIIYGNAAHAFMNPHINRPEVGLCFHPLVSKRAWKAMQHWLKECFQRANDIYIPLQG